MAFVYFIEIVDGPVKIGLAGNLKGHFYNIKAALPYPIRFLGAQRCEDAARKERSLHRRLAKFQLRGEWFQRGPALCEFQKFQVNVTSIDEAHEETHANLTKRFEMRCSPEDFALWSRHAKSLGMSAAAWLRVTANDYCADRRTTRLVHKP